MGDIFAVPRAAVEAGYLRDTSSLSLVLEFYGREHVPLVRYLCFLNVNPETAKEIVHDCFVKLHEHLQAGGDASNLRAWLYRVAHNLARNSQSSARLRHTEPLASLTLLREPEAGGSSAEESLLEAERMSLLRSEIRQLPETQRQALVLRAQGLKYREIGEILNLSTSTVAENIQRGTQTLRNAIG